MLQSQTQRGRKPTVQLSRQFALATRIRGRMLDAVLAENPALKVEASHSMARTASWQEDVRAGMSTLLQRHRGKFQGVRASFDGQAFVIDDLLQAAGVRKGDW